MRFMSPLTTLLILLTINEVTLFFNDCLFRGNRTTKAHTDGFDAFASPNLPPLLELVIHIRRLNTPQTPTILVY